MRGGSRMQRKAKRPAALALALALASCAWHPSPALGGQAAYEGEMSTEVYAVPRAGLEVRIEEEPAALSSGGRGARALRAVAEGGTAPYSFEWSLSAAGEGPRTVRSASSDDGTDVLAIEDGRGGLYAVEATDAEGTTARAEAVVEGYGSSNAEDPPGPEDPSDPSNPSGSTPGEPSQDARPSTGPGPQASDGGSGQGQPARSVQRAMAKMGDDPLIWVLLSIACGSSGALLLIVARLRAAGDDRKRPPVRRRGRHA